MAATDFVRQHVDPENYWKAKNKEAERRAVAEHKADTQAELRRIIKLPILDVSVKDARKTITDGRKIGDEVGMKAIRELTEQAAEFITAAVDAQACLAKHPTLSLVLMALLTRPFARSRLRYFAGHGGEASCCVREGARKADGNRHWRYRLGSDGSRSGRGGVGARAAVDG